MSFEDYIRLIISSNKSGLQDGVNAFLSAYKQGKIEYSKQAFSKGRQRIKPAAFLALFQQTVQKFYEIADSSQWNGYHLLGIDGMKMDLPCTKELEDLYGTQRTSGEPQVQALVSCMYDLLAGIIVDVQLEGCKANERTTAKTMIENFAGKQIAKPVFIMDRGYPSAELIATIMQQGYHYVMRCSKEFIQKMKLPDCDNVLEYTFLRLKTPIKLRIIKVPLSEGNVEYLVTNLFESNITVDDFKWLYHQRWNIETKYNDLKNKLCIEDFSGYSAIAVQQDFYATLLLANLTGILQYELREEIERVHTTKENQYQYKMNITQTISEQKRTVIEMLATENPLKRERLFAQITKSLQKAVVPVRPGRSFPRVVKHAD